MKKAIGILCAILLTTSCASPLAAQQSLLWQVTSPQGEVSHLFGTYHLVGNEYLEAHPRVKQAYEQSQTIVVETVIDSSRLMEVSAMALMPGQTLWDFYDTAQYQLIDQSLQEATGMPLSNMVQLRPVAVAMFYTLSITQKELARSELNFPGKPIDVWLAADAAKKNKEVVGLETMMEQMTMLYKSDPLEEQADILLEMIQDNETRSLSLELLELYQEQDLAGMYRLSEEIGDTYGDMAILLDDRNQRWLEELTPLLNKGDVFIAVGALHLPGDEGLIALLRELGYELKAISAQK